MQEPSSSFAAPSLDSIDGLDLNAYLIAHPAATFFVRVEGDSMLGAGIASGDLLIIDRALSAKDGDLVMAIVSGEFTVRRIKKEKDRWVLYREPVEGSFRENSLEIQIWGVVTHAIRKLNALCSR